MTLRATPLFVIALGVAGCNLAPPAVMPFVDIPPAYKEADGWAPARPQDTGPWGSWWRAFDDPELDQLESQLESANQDLRAAVARFDEARALARIAQSDLVPTVAVRGAASANRLSRAVANPLPADQFANYGLNLDLGYEIDVWGRVRNTAKAGRARAQAAAGDLAEVDLRIQAELATDYLILRADDAQQAILDRTVAAYAKAFELTQDRLKAGYSAEPQVAASEAQFRLAQAQAADIVLQRAQLEHAIAILIGQPPARFALPANPLTQTPPKIDIDLPGTLLERRPDVAAAERRVAAANADIGVARAAAYPTFSLGAVLGVQAAQSSRLFTAPAEAWSVGPTAALALLDGGRLRGVNAQAKAAYTESVAVYRQTVLDAFGQVEDALTAMRQLEREALSQEAGVAAARRSNGQASRLFEGGLSTYYDVVTTENIALSAELTAARLRGQRMVAAVALVRALGGGWRRDLDPRFGPAAQTTPGPRG
jgi:NodT family efflux transporter outer membrane factor (OMF) lipoprotein